MMRAVDEPITLMPEEGLSSKQSSSVGHDRMGRPVVKPFDSQISSVREIPSHSSESESVRRSSMRAEDESITLKEKACRPVCRRRRQ